MKAYPLAHLRSSVARVAALAALALGVSSSSFGVVVNFSGGGGTPLSMTLASPVTYSITQVMNGNFGPLFSVQGAGNPFLTSSAAVTGSITFSVNGGAPHTIDTAFSGFAHLNFAANDIHFYGSLMPLSVGDTVVLSAGTLMTTANVAGVASASGDFQTFIARDTGTRISTFGAAVGGNAPDAGSTVAMLGLGLLGLFSFARISRRAA